MITNFELNSPSILRLLYWSAPCLLVGGFAWLNRHYQMDDALIYLRYVQNFQDGQGLVYNIGEVFNGMSSPLYIALLLLVSTIITNIQATSIFISTVALMGAALTAGKLWTKSEGEALFTSLIIASSSYYYWNFGMETALFLFLIGLSLLLYQRDSAYFVIALALVAITRNEGVILGGLMCADYLYCHRKLPPIRLLVLATVIFLLPFFFNYFYYGTWVSATGAAKIGQGNSGLWGEGLLFLDMSPLVYLAFGESFSALLLFLGFTIYGIYLSRNNRSAIVGLSFGAILFLVYTGFNVPSYNWYYAPMVYLATIFACRGIWRVILRSIDWRQQNEIARVGSAILVSLTAFMLFHMVSFEQRGPLKHYKDIGIWLAENVAPQSSIAMVEIGTVGWYSSLHIVDILGLVTPHNAARITNRQFYDWFSEYQPEYILRHEPIWGHERSITALEEAGAYVADTDFKFSEYVLLRKSPAMADEMIAEISEKKAMSLNILPNLLASNDAPSSLLSLENNRLFSHAPMALKAELRYSVKFISISYGLDINAAGLHNGVCFNVYKSNLDESESEREVLVNDCISTQTSPEEMSRNSTAEFSGKPGDVLVFETYCLGTCDYAWSYWKEVSFMGT